MHPHLTALLSSVGGHCPYPTTTTGHSIFGAIARPIAAVLAFFYSLVPNYAFAIVCLSVVWMIIIAPLTLKSTRSMLAMQRLQPQLKKLQAEHKNDRQALNQAMMDLYKQEGVSPLGGCLPMLLPLPVFFALFQVIDGLSYTHLVNGIKCADPRYLSPHTQMFHAIWSAGGRINAVGMDLAKNALSAHSSFLVALPYFVLLLVMIGTQYLQSAQMYARNPAAQDNPQMRFMKYLPIVFGIIFIRFPAGVILYYAASNVCRILQQSLMYRFDPQVKKLAAKDIREVEEEVDEIEHGQRRREAPSTTAAPSGGGRFRQALARQQQLLEERQRHQEEGRGKASPGRGQPAGKGRAPAAKTTATGKAGAATGEVAGKAGKSAAAPKGSGSGRPAPAGTGGAPGRNQPRPQEAKATPRRAGPPNGTNGANGSTGSAGRPSSAEPPPPAEGGTSPAGSRTGATGARGGNRPPAPNRKRRGR